MVANKYFNENSVYTNYKVILGVQSKAIPSLLLCVDPILCFLFVCLSYSMVGFDIILLGCV